MSTKRCTRCKKIKPYDEFGNKKRSTDGLQSHCKECINLYNNQYKSTNKEKIAPKVKEYYTKHKDKINTYYKEYMADPGNAKKELERQRRKQRKRRALKLQVQENYTKLDEQYTMDLFNQSCVNCGSIEDLQIDHHYPLSKGNALTRNNAVVLCISCNSSKGAKLPEEFYTPEKLLWITEKLPCPRRGRASMR